MIVITGHGDVPLAVEAMKAGAVDFIEKPFDDEAHAGRRARRAAAGAQRPTERDAERAEIDAAARDACRRASARCWTGWSPASPTRSSPIDLGISPRTVEVYRANVMTKMQAGSLSELVRMALLAGVTGKDDDAA